MNILIVDDFKTQRLLAKKAINEMNLGHTVHDASDGAEALKLLDEKDFGCVITDYEMPNMNGIELLKAIRNSSKHEKVPVIFVTSVEKIKSEARMLGANGFLVKPYNQIDLQQKLRRVLNIKSAGKKYSVLMVDDVESQAEIHEIFFKLDAVNYDIANSAHEAWEKLKKKEYDLLITDLRMPRVDGERLLKKIKKVPQLNHLPVIVITEDTSVKLEELDSLADALYHKPVNPAAVKNEIKKLMFD